MKLSDLTQEKLDELIAAHDGYNQANLKNQQALDNEIQARKDDVAKFQAELAAALKAQVDELTAKHQAEIVKLKEQVLIPALKDLQARQKADLESKHAAELAQL